MDAAQSLASPRHYALGFVATLILAVLLGVVRAWAITVLWSWFVVPAFGLPEISKVTAFGRSSPRPCASCSAAPNTSSEHLTTRS
jgi:hypothetical protein